MTALTAPRITYTADSDVDLLALRGLGWAVPDYVRARPADTDRPIDPAGRWIVETVWTDGTVEFSAEFSGVRGGRDAVDRADCWVLARARCWDRAIPQSRVLPFFGVALVVAAGRFAEMGRDLADGIGHSAQLMADRAEQARFMGQYLPAF